MLRIIKNTQICVKNYKDTHEIQNSDYFWGTGKEMQSARATLGSFNHVWSRMFCFLTSEEHIWAFFLPQTFHIHIYTH